MKARFLFWTGTQARDVPVRDVLYFNKFAEEIVEEYRDMFQGAIERGVANVLEEAFD